MTSRSSLACAVIALALSLSACTTTDSDSVTDGREDQTADANDADANDATTSDPAVGTAGATGTVRLADVAAAPDKYFGRTVTVVADVEEVFGPNAFALDEDAPFAGGIDNDVLVFSKKAGSLAAIDDQWMNNQVRVTGTVGKMTVVEIEREIGWDLNPELEAEIEKRTAVIIAESVQRTDDTERPATQP